MYRRPSPSKILSFRRIMILYDPETRRESEAVHEEERIHIYETTWLLSSNKNQQNFIFNTWNSWAQSTSKVSDE
jgi:hypothetical protein